MIPSNNINWTIYRVQPAENPGGALYRRRRASGVTYPVAARRPGSVTRQHPQYRRRPRRKGLRFQPAHLGRARTHAAWLPAVCRHAVDRAATGSACSQPTRTQPDPLRSATSDDCGVQPAVRSQPVCRAGDDAAPQPCVPSGRIHQPVGKNAFCSSS